MQIIRSDNFARDNVSEGLVCSVESKFEAEAMLNGLRKHLCSDNASFWYRIEPDDYKLYTFEP